MNLQSINQSRANKQQVAIGAKSSVSLTNSQNTQQDSFVKSAHLNNISFGNDNSTLLNKLLDRLNFLKECRNYAEAKAGDYYLKSEEHITGEYSMFKYYNGLSDDYSSDAKTANKEIAEIEDKIRELKNNSGN